MNKVSMKLTLLLMFQAGLVLFFWRAPEQTAGQSGDESLLTLHESHLDSMTISEQVTADSEDSLDPSEQSEVKMLSFKKVNEQWVMPDHSDFPVAQDKLNKVLGSLSETRRGWPVGKTEIAAKALKVTEENYEKRVSLSVGEKTDVLYLGTSPGFRKVHARLGGEDKTWAIVLNSWDFPVNPADWRSKEVYEVPRAHVTQVTFKGTEVVLQKTEKGFSVASLQEGFEVQDDVVNKLLKVALSPRYEDVFTKALPKDAESWAEWDVEFVSSGESRAQKFQVWSSKQEEHLILKSSEHPWFFIVTREALAEVKNLTYDDLVKASEASASDDGSPVDARIPSEPSASDS
ncbi:MAG: DUF4340 domain-containing protein [Oligoflexales bacterium]